MNSDNALRILIVIYSEYKLKITKINFDFVNLNPTGIYNKHCLLKSSRYREDLCKLSSRYRLSSSIWRKVTFHKVAGLILKNRLSDLVTILPD